ncbi:MAG: Txe/YoeB family addiction module toxin [Deltaproteobacteria bacterium]|nr:Txe/YoeB family addiction module toxin [Deltaproteobacteria bacterium]
MTVRWADDAWNDYVWWSRHDKKRLDRINKLIDAISKDPLRGVGKPEPLRHDLAGYWSRRIDDEHRLVYKVDKRAIYIAACRYHYGR